MGNSTKLRITLPAAGPQFWHTLSWQRWHVRVERVLAISLTLRLCGPAPEKALGPIVLKKVRTSP